MSRRSRIPGLLRTPIPRNHAPRKITLSSCGMLRLRQRRSASKLVTLGETNMSTKTQTSLAVQPFSSKNQMAQNFAASTRSVTRASFRHSPAQPSKREQCVRRNVRGQIATKIMASSQSQVTTVSSVLRQNAPQMNVVTFSRAGRPQRQRWLQPQRVTYSIVTTTILADFTTVMKA